MTKRENELQNILNDKVHGSSELYNLLIGHFQKYCNDYNYISIASKRVKKNLSHFPVIINFINNIEALLKKDNSVSLNLYLQKLLTDKTNIYHMIFRKAENSIRKMNTLITISHSKTILEIFKLWKQINKEIKVIVCESRPDKEGILMAEDLIKLKVKTEIITEAMAGKIIKVVDAVILGADQLLSNGNIVNKTGSRLLAIAAKYENIPVYVFSTSDKKVKKRISIKETTSKVKFTIQDHKKLKFVNDDFEEIEKELLTRIFTD